MLKSHTLCTSASASNSSVHVTPQSNTVEPLYNGHLWGTMFWPLNIYRQRWPLLRGCLVHKLFIWDLGAWLLYSSWPLFGGGC